MLQNPLVFSDLLGLEVLYCAGKIDTYHHIWLCAQDECAGFYPSSPAGILIGGGEVLPDPYIPEGCSEAPKPKGCDAEKFEVCVAEENKPGNKHYYSLLFYSCGNWAGDVIYKCAQKACE